MGRKVSMSAEKGGLECREGWPMSGEKGDHEWEEG